jgi:hypothetical protein
MERLLTFKNIYPWAREIFWPCPENNFRPLFLEKRFLAFYLTIFFALKLVILPFYVFLPQASFYAEVVASTLIDLTNQQRQARGLPPLAESSALKTAALNKAQDMLAKDYFNHISPQGLTPWYWFKKAGYNYLAAGENLAIGFLDSEEVAKAWLNSALHRQNLLNPNFKEIGIGVLNGNFQGRETIVAVQMFGSRKPGIILAPAATPTISPAAVPGELTLEVGEKISKVAGLPAQAVSFGLTSFDDVSGFFVNVFLGLVAISLFGTTLVNYLKQNRATGRELALETGLFVVLFLASNVFNKDLLLSFIPHDLLLY